jgi:hypothetical protein
MIPRILGRVGLVILLLILLAGCAAKFDSNEYSRLVDIRHALLESRCADAADVRAMSKTIQNDLSWLMIYSQNLPHNDNTTSMLAAMKTTADELSIRTSRDDFSVVYCRLKIRTLQDQLDIILKTTANRPR